MTKPLRLIKPADSLSPYRLAMTQTSEDILRSIKMAGDNAPMLTMVAGVPGCGKSETVLRYTQAHPGTILHSVVASECTIWDLAKHLMEWLEIGEPNSRRMIEARQRIEEEVGLDRVVIFDEAQYLTRRNPRGPDDHQAFEWLRQMAENGLFSVVFCGDLSLAAIVQEVPQLYRRIIRPVIIRKIPRADVSLIVARYGVTDDAMVDALVAVAHRHGGLADVVNVIEHAKRFAGSGALTGKA